MRASGRIVLVTGARDWAHADVVFAWLAALAAAWGPDTEVLHGAAHGADQCADHAARALGLRVTPYPAHWQHRDDCHPHCPEAIGRVAGPMRNRKMLDRRPDLVGAFHDDLRASKGTRDCVVEALRRGLEVRVITSKGVEGPAPRALYDLAVR